jgi:hypothetical protein
MSPAREDNEVEDVAWRFIYDQVSSWFSTSGTFFFPSGTVDKLFWMSEYKIVVLGAIGVGRS